jgi:SH3 domain-containing YSC84-like protein 1
MQSRKNRLILAAALAVSLFAGAATPPAWAQSASDDQTVVDHALGTLRDLRSDKEFGNAKALLNRARGVLIAPRIFKAGFFFGGEGGEAVLLARNSHGWSNPAFYTVASASFGLQIGAQESEMVMLVMSDRAMRALMQDHFKIGANAGLAIATLGSTVEGATTAAAGADIVVWASSSGAYAGISLDGTLIEPRREDDAAYYGRSVTSSDIVLRREVHNPAASSLVRTLGSL